MVDYESKIIKKVLTHPYGIEPKYLKNELEILAFSENSNYDYINGIFERLKDKGLIILKELPLMADDMDGSEPYKVTAYFVAMPDEIVKRRQNENVSG